MIAAVRRPRFARRRTWRNHAGEQAIDQLRIQAPQTLEEVVGVVREAEASGCAARAVGSGHSWSDVALATGFLREPTG